MCWVSGSSCNLSFSLFKREREAKNNYLVVGAFMSVLSCKSPLILKDFHEGEAYRKQGFISRKSICTSYFSHYVWRHFDNQSHGSYFQNACYSLLTNYNQFKFQFLSFTKNCCLNGTSYQDKKNQSFQDVHVFLVDWCSK